MGGCACPQQALHHAPDEGGDLQLWCRDLSAALKRKRKAVEFDIGICIFLIRYVDMYIYGTYKHLMIEKISGLGGVQPPPESDPERRHRE